MTHGLSLRRQGGCVELHRLTLAAAEQKANAEAANAREKELVRDAATKEIARLREKKQNTTAAAKSGDKAKETGEQGTVSAAGRFVVDLRSNNPGQG